LLPAAPLSLSADAPSAAEGQHTTHLSIVDGEGLAVAMTVSLNLPFGSGLTVPGTGVLLNDQMDDFYSGQANAFGLVGNSRNAPEAAKRPLSSMAPTMVFDAAGLYLVLGSPGGSNIPTAGASVIRNLVEDHMEPGAAIHAPRVHHQWMPDHLELERDFSGDLPADVKKNATLARFPIGNVQMIVRTEQGLRGVSDCRGRGEAWSGHVP
jgi:gamma-glutamyltranspeptidase/glutathione hydrolase